LKNDAGQLLAFDVQGDEQIAISTKEILVAAADKKWVEHAGRAFENRDGAERRGANEPQNYLMDLLVRLENRAREHAERLMAPEHIVSTILRRISGASWLFF